MLESGSEHLKIQEQIDCQLNVDPLREMSLINDEEDKQEAALKYLALLVLHGVNANAKKISLKSSESGAVIVEAKYRKTALPAPDGEITGNVVDAIRSIGHLEEDKDSIPLAIGIRDSSVLLKVKVKKKGGKASLKIEFPE